MSQGEISTALSHIPIRQQYRTPYPALRSHGRSFRWATSLNIISLPEFVDLHRPLQFRLAQEAELRSLQRQLDEVRESGKCTLGSLL